LVPLLLPLVPLPVVEPDVLEPVEPLEFEPLAP
jgi:hypothetical protein